MTIRLLGAVLVFVGISLLGSAAVATTDWMVCLSNGGGQACRASKADAVQAWVGAANVGLGLAVQQQPNP